MFAEVNPRFLAIESHSYISSMVRMTTIMQSKYAWIFTNWISPQWISMSGKVEYLRNLPIGTSALRQGVRCISQQWLVMKAL